MGLFTAAETRIYIGGVLADQSADFAASDFDGQTWTEIGQIETLGTLGDTAEEVTINVMGDNRTKRLKGTRSGGAMEIVAGLDYGDAGQVAVLAAERDHENYAFRVVFGDADSSECYFIAIVGGAQEALESANEVAKLNISLWVNSNIAKA